MSKTQGDEVAVGPVGRRRKRSKQERRAIVEETLAPGVSVARVARAHGVNANQVFHWRKLYREGRLTEVSAGAALIPVRVTDRADSVRPVAVAAHPVKPAAGIIRIEAGRAWVAIEGAADPATVRVVLECLLG
jgi:transposase